MYVIFYVSLCRLVANLVFFCCGVSFSCLLLLVRSSRCSLFCTELPMISVVFSSSVFVVVQFAVLQSVAVDDFGCCLSVSLIVQLFVLQFGVFQYIKVKHTCTYVLWCCSKTISIANVQIIHYLHLQATMRVPRRKSPQGPYPHNTALSVWNGRIGLSCVFRQ